ncbi:MAG: TonB-dependent receptor [Bacteroidales bacterium]|nr:TonB-dependent receptor [Bacteroidales bacterium]
MKNHHSFNFFLFAITFCFFFTAPNSWSQVISGSVSEKDPSGKESGIPGVNIFWIGTSKGAFSNQDGKFVIPSRGIRDYRLVFSSLGYQKDTIVVSRDQTHLDHVMISDKQNLNEVEIKEKLDNTFISKLRTQATTVISVGELQRAACCNLAESFETNASVDVSYSDAVSGARQIQLLGLSGIYSQIMTENVPLIRGLATPFGLNYIPGSWMESIQVAKGTSSVVQGYESITGQINVEYKKPETAPKFFLNVYGNSNLRLEANADGAIKINDKLSASLLVHASTFQHKFDRNGDGFMDLPEMTTITAMNRWDYLIPGKWVSRFGVKYLYEDRNGGQMDFDKSAWNTDTTGISNDTKKYGIGIRTNRLEAFWKNGIFLGPGGKSSLGLILSGINHQQDAFYGINLYHGHEQNFNANLILTTSFDENKHRISAGFSYLIDDYSENFVQTLLEYRYQLLPTDSVPGQANLYTLAGDSVMTWVMDRSEWVTGTFFEYTFEIPGKFAVIAGLRGDYNSSFGYYLTPRLHLRFNPSKSATIRASVGKGYRSPNLLAENNAVFASQRELCFASDLGNEEAWNLGLNFTWNFNLFGEKGELSLDAYRTSFVHQIIVDQDSLPNAVFFYNLDGKSFANSVQAQLTCSPVTRFTITAAFRLNDVWLTENGHLVRKSMVNLYKGLLSLGYATKFEKWKFDLTGQLNGPSRIPDTQKMPASLQQPEWSPVWFNLLTQVTRKFKHFEIYLGGENLINFRQMDPILEYWKPFHTHFDASMAWGPVVGITVYTGIRLTIN